MTDTSYRGTFSVMMLDVSPRGHVEHVPLDPSKASYCTQTIATMGENECRRNRFTHDLYNRRGRDLWYVGVASGDESDIARWAEWLAKTHLA